VVSDLLTRGVFKMYEEIAMKYKALALTLAIACMVMASSAAHAELIHGVNVTDNGLVDTANGSSNAYASDGNADDGHKWFSVANGANYFELGTAPVLTIDLGASYKLSGVAFWNYNIYGNATKEFSLAFSTNGTTYGSSTNFTTNTPAEPPVQENFSLSEVTARYVQMTMTENWYDGVNRGGDRVGFCDIQFNGTAVPEPTMVAMIATGLISLLAYAWRKQK